MQPSVTLEAVGKRYSKSGPWVVADADLTLHPGSITKVVGANGSGKSTLLKIVAHVSPPTTGEVSLPSRISFVPERQPARIRMTARQYLTHLGRIRGVSRDLLNDRVQEICDRLGLHPGPDVAVDQLSKGNRQKVFLAQALLVPLDLVVLDEALSGLDERALAGARALIVQARGDGAAVLFTNHDRDEQIPLDHTILIEGSRLVAGSSAVTTRARKRVRVTRTGEETGSELVAEMPGVVVIREEGDRSLVVDLEVWATNDLLVSLIAAGFSIESVADLT